MIHDVDIVDMGYNIDVDILGDCIFPYFPLDRLDLDPHFIHVIHHETPPGCTCAPTHLAPSCHPMCSQLPAPEWRLAPRGQRMMGEGNNW